MGDFRSDLDRIGRRVDQRSDAFERLERRRRTKERNGRIAAGTLALLVAVGGSVAAYTALRDDDPHVEGIAGGTPPSAAPDVGRILCDGTTTTIETAQVRPQLDGVHLLVTNTSEIDLSFQWDLGGDNAPMGERELVLPLAPGMAEVRCQDPAEDAGATGGYVELEVVDPDSIYVPIELECGEQVGWYADFAPGATGDPDPVQSGRDHLHGLEPGDVVEAAGYPEAETRQVRVVRDGEVIAVVEFFPDGQGGWLQVSGNACKDGIS